MELMLVTLGAAKATDLVKELIPYTLQAWTKSFLTVIFAAALALLAGGEVKEWALLAAGGAGGASLIHTVQKLAGALGDQARLNVMLEGGRRRR